MQPLKKLEQVLQGSWKRGGPMTSRYHNSGLEKGVIDIPEESRMTQPVDAQNGIVADKENIPQSDSTPNSTVPNTEKSVPAQNLELGSHPRDATEDEVATLPHVTDRIPIAAWIVILAGAAERATYFGVIAPWRDQYVQKKPQLSCKNGKYVIVDGTRTLQLLYNLYYWFVTRRKASK
ncbi:MAG: hypothetical protein Q9176_006455 [Flavoplaca citrina]